MVIAGAFAGRDSLRPLAELTGAAAGPWTAIPKKIVYKDDRQGRPAVDNSRAENQLRIVVVGPQNSFAPALSKAPAGTATANPLVPGPGSLTWARSSTLKGAFYE
jgi:hypothetical protein